MRQLKSLVISLLLLFALAACGSAPPASATAGGTSESPSAPSFPAPVAVSYPAALPLDLADYEAGSFAENGVAFTLQYTPADDWQKLATNFWVRLSANEYDGLEAFMLSQSAADIWIPDNTLPPDYEVYTLHSMATLSSEEIMDELYPNLKAGNFSTPRLWPGLLTYDEYVAAYSITQPVVLRFEASFTYTEEALARGPQLLHGETYTRYMMLGQTPDGAYRIASITWVVWAA